MQNWSLLQQMTKNVWAADASYQPNAADGKNEIK